MLVGERMSHPVISVPPEMPVVEALNLMKRERIRRTPVVKDGKVVGIISDNMAAAHNRQAAQLVVRHLAGGFLDRRIF